MKEHALKPDRGSVAGRVVLEGKAVHVVDRMADPEFKLTAGSAFSNVRTILGVPLLREGTPIGVLILTRPTFRSSWKGIRSCRGEARPPAAPRSRAERFTSPTFSPTPLQFDGRPEDSRISNLTCCPAGA